MVRDYLIWIGPAIRATHRIISFVLAVHGLTIFMAIKTIIFIAGTNWISITIELTRFFHLAWASITWI